MLVKIVTNNGDAWVNPEDVVFIQVKEKFKNYKAKKLNQPYFSLCIYLRNMGHNYLRFDNLEEALSEMERLAFLFNSHTVPKKESK